MQRSPAGWITRARLSRLALTVLMLVAGLSAGSAQAATVVVNNGLEPPAPTNLFSDTAHAGDNVYVRNVGCPPDWPLGSAGAACPSPGVSTTVELAAGGVANSLRSRDTSEIVVRGGTVSGVYISDSSTGWLVSGDAGSLTVEGQATAILFGTNVANSLLCSGTSFVSTFGGSIGWASRAMGSCNVIVYGGAFGGPLEAYNGSLITVYGSDFRIDGLPVAMGPIAATSGTLTGTLDSGDSINVSIYHGGYDSILTGTIELRDAPNAVPGLGVPGAIGGAVMLLLSGCAAMRRERRTQQAEYSS